MTKIWTSPETGKKLNIVVVKEFHGADGNIYLAHKVGATSSKYVFGVRAADCE